jgi:hypothetical protein
MKSCAEYADFDALLPFMSTAKAIQIAPNNLSATTLAIRAQGGGHCILAAFSFHSTYD